MASPIEILPPHCLELICEYLDDESATRPSLQAFSRTSKRCCAVAEAQQYSQIELKIRDPEDLQNYLRRLSDLLQTRVVHRHVRRLKVSWALTAEERKIESSSSIQNEEVYEDEFWTGGWNRRPYFNMHSFCLPSERSMQGNGAASIIDRPEQWAPLGQFTSQFPGLKDFVWAAGWYIPPSVLSAVSGKGCRLHIHSFRLPSLIQTRDQPQPISAADYSLLTSPSLFSIVVHTGSFESGGKLNYIEEVVLLMASGLAPNLTHMCVIPKGPLGELEITQAIILGKPAWRGFFPGKAETERTAEANRLPMHDKVQSLVFPTYVPSGINHWARFQNFNNLRCLVLPWENNSASLAQIASQGDLMLLQKLQLSSIEDETEEAQRTLNRFLQSLTSLEGLELRGYICPEVFDTIINHHGKSLRTLSIDREFSKELRNPLVILSAHVIEQLASHSPYLKYLSIPINRTRGDKHEVGIYRALSKFPRLEYVALRLMYSVGPDNELWDEEKDGPYPLDSRDLEDIPLACLKETFSNCAVDETLARGIFNLISGEGTGTLRYLQLKPDRKLGPNAPGIGHGLFNNTLGWLSRSFSCTRVAHSSGEFTVKALDTRDHLVICEEEWEYMMGEEEEYFPEANFVQAFKELWPQKTEKWWRDWRSLPLDRAPRSVGAIITRKRASDFGH